MGFAATFQIMQCKSCLKRDVSSIQRRVVVLDFGSQYSHLIVRRCREAGVECIKFCYNVSVETIQQFHPYGIILSGGPASSFESDAPHVSEDFWRYIERENIPTLGVCYGMQEMAHYFGGTVSRTEQREAGPASLSIAEVDLSEDNLARTLLEGVTDASRVWMSHRDVVTKLPAEFVTLATTTKSNTSSLEGCIAVICQPRLRMWGVQFHPEVTQSEFGRKIIENFLYKIAEAPKTWTIDQEFAVAMIEKVKATVGPKQHVIGAISGGVDSTVAAALVHKAIGSRFHCFTVDTGLLRAGEATEVATRLARTIPGLQLQIVDAKAEFFKALEGIVDPETKRKTIGNLFVETLITAKNKIKSHLPSGELDDALLLQGTLYTDVIESTSTGAPSRKIKTHHNVGGLPEQMTFGLLEPLKELFKDEVRQLGKMLSLDCESLTRHPFPGPGLAIRIIGAVTPERVAILQRVDEIFIRELKFSGDYDKISQAFAVFLPETLSVGIVGDERVYGPTIVLRAVETNDFMTGDWYAIDQQVLRKCSTEITNSVHEVVRVCYDISSKPPATIEWE